MELSGLDSKNYDAIIRFKETLPAEDNTPAIIHNIPEVAQKINEYGEPEVLRIRQEQKQLSPEEIDEIVAAYRSGSTTYALAKQYNCHRGTISEHLKKRGVNVTNAKSMSKIDLADAVSMYENMHTSQEIADKYGVHPHIVVCCLRAEGVRIRGRWGR